MALNHFPLGIKFDPSDFELIHYYLIPKIQEDIITQPTTIIQEANVYAIEPQYLNWPLVSYLKNEERYYFVKRERLTTKNGTSKRAKRTLKSDNGFWRLSTGERKIKDDIGNVVGLYSSLNFWTYKDPLKKDSGQAIKSTRWLMTEYKLPGNEFQEWVICKIRDTKKEKATLSHHHQVEKELSFHQQVSSFQVPQQEQNQISSQTIHQSDNQQQEVLQYQDPPNYDLPKEDSNIIAEDKGDDFGIFFMQSVNLDNTSFDDQEWCFRPEEDNNDEKISMQQNTDIITSLPEVVEYVESETPLLEDWAN